MLAQRDVIGEVVILLPRPPRLVSYHVAFTQKIE